MVGRPYLVPYASGIVECCLLVNIVRHPKVRKVDVSNDLHRYALPLPVQPYLAHVEGVAFKDGGTFNSIHLQCIVAVKDLPTNSQLPEKL